MNATRNECDTTETETQNHFGKKVTNTPTFGVDANFGAELRRKLRTLENKYPLIKHGS